MDGVGFVTHFQLERLLGGGRTAQQQRRRLVERRLLPEAEWLRVDRTRLAIFPEFSLAALLGSSASRVGALEQIAHTGRSLYASQAFEGLRGPLEEAMRVPDAMRGSTALSTFLLREAVDEMAAWRGVVAEAETQLRATAHLRLEAAVVRVQAVREDGCLVTEDGHPEPTVVPLLAVADELAVGAHANLARVGLLDAQRLFLLGVPAHLVHGEADELDALSALMADGPARLPAVVDAGDDDDEPVPLLGRRRRTVWQQGNTMTRVGAGR